MITNNPRELKDEMEKFIKDKLEVNNKIKTALKIGNELQIKAINVSGERVFINNDLTKQERAIDAQIRKRVEEEKINGKRVKRRYQKLTIEGKE
ncbi:hypothetical protein FQA39_LY04625 [Lamprigera yunnana]|nr:hypothetical protein FQA39_LY04625 [Lamprigera yunnana]